MDLTKKKCVPCELGTKPFSEEEAEKYLEEVNSYSSSEARSKTSDSSHSVRTIKTIWELVDDDKGLKIRKRFIFDTYRQGIEFVGKIADVAEREDHHPDLYVGYKKVTVNLTTHNIGGLSENDFIMAAKIDNLPK